jgi:hypothetical protein
MVRLVPVKCPNCGANVRIDPERELATCSYCQTSSFVQTQKRRLPEEARKDNPMVFDVEAYQRAARTSAKGVLFIYLFAAAGLVLVAFITFSRSQTPAPPPPKKPSEDPGMTARDEKVIPPPEVPKVEPPPEPLSTSGADVKVTAGKIVVSGRLPAEVIQRIVRQRFGRFRFCHAQAQRAGQHLFGTINVRFVIGRDGSVSNVSDGGSDVPSPTLTSCIRAAFAGIEFPQPEGGIVTVQYSLNFAEG